MLPPLEAWQKRIQAIAMLHHGYCTLDPQWTQRQTAKDLSLQPDYISMALQTARYLCDPKIAHAPTLEGAYAMVKKKTYQKATAATNTIAEAILPPPQPPTILPADFLTWAPTYTGPKFNFIHCDFPQDYDEQIKYIMCIYNNGDKIMTPAGHLMLWFEICHYTNIVDYLTLPGLKVKTYPLIWLASDNTGQAPHVNHPHHMYKTALIASRGDCPLIRSVHDAYAAPTIKDKNAKPIPMLAHFFQMFIDKNTSVLDAFCTNDNAIRAATRLGAQYICGLRPSVQP